MNNRTILKRNNRFCFGIDWDDVLAPFNDVAVMLANGKYNKHLTIEDITSWEHGPETECVKEFYDNPETYRKQFVPEGSKEFICRLQELGEVYIVTAVAPQFMGERVRQIKEAFPDFPDENIIMGTAKNVMQFDVMLDDGPHNILKSRAQYPVLYRKPWNRNISGVLAVNTFDEFFELVGQIKASMAEADHRINKPSVIALVGPSGSRKNELAEALQNMRAGEIIPSYTTYGGTDSIRKIHIPETLFQDMNRKGEFVSTTVYAGELYGTRRCDIQKILDDGGNVIMPLDICGAIGIKRIFPTVIVFCKDSRESMIERILNDECSVEKKKYKLLSMEKEIENSKLCDYRVCTENLDEAAYEIGKLLTSVHGSKK